MNPPAATGSADRAPLNFSVIVPTCARPELLAACLECLAPGAQNYPGDGYEVIVSDDTPLPGTPPSLRARFPWVRWLEGPRRGPAANRNHAAAAAAGAWLAFTDDDCLPEPGWLASFAVAAAATPAPDVLEGRTIADRPRRSFAERSPVNETGGYLFSCNFAVRAEVFRRLHGFDEGFPFASMEDMDLALRLRRAGVVERFVPQATVCHPWRLLAGFSAMWAAEDRHLASLRYYLTRHPAQWPHHTPRKQLKANAHRFYYETIPGLIKWHGRGFGVALAWHLHHFYNCAALSRPTAPPR